jgi:hypothetical protein
VLTQGLDGEEERLRDAIREAGEHGGDHLRRKTDINIGRTTGGVRVHKEV